MSRMAGASLIPPLPSSLIARILAYNVTTVKDVAQLRLVGKAIGQQAIHLLPLETSHWIQCPERRLGDDASGGSYVERFCAIPWYDYETYGTVAGDTFEVLGHQVSLIESTTPIQSNVTVRVIGKPSSLRQAVEPPKKKSAATYSFFSKETKYLEKLAQICDAMVNATKLEQLLQEDSDEMMFLEPPHGSNTPAITEHLAKQEHRFDDNRYFAMPALVTFEIDPSATYVMRTSHVDDIKTFYHIKLTNQTTISNDTFDRSSPFFQPLYPGGHVWAVDAGSRNHGDLRVVHMLLYLQAENIFYIIMDRGLEIKSHQSLWLSSLWNDHQQHQLVEGVVVVDSFINEAFRRELNDKVSGLAKKQERENAVDYHPHSNQVVRDLVHPALYSYIHKVSPLMANVSDVLPAQFPTEEVEQEPGEDFWGRTYEASPYQWLPSYVNVSAEGSCTFDTYINNLTPRDDPVHAALYESLEKLLGHALPFVESVYSYVHAVRPLLRQENQDFSFDDSPLRAMDTKHISLRGHKLQVIPKIVDYELTPEHDTYEGVWHVEGMSHEEIVLTVLYILDRDDAIIGGEIEFKRAFLSDEAELIFAKLPQMRPQILDNAVDEGLVPLGTVATPVGRLVVFPNSHVHRVKAMRLIRPTQDDDSRRGEKAFKRRIVVFFLVNPQKRIVSTREVAPQQCHSGGKLHHDEALQHRLALMAERKYTKQDWNVRPIELCEH